jgi:hypothetical membrane protein
MSKTQPDRTQRLLAACGIVGPIAYAAVVAVLGWLRPNYSHASKYMSELGEAGATNAWVMNLAGFGLLGVLIIAFALALYRGTEGGWHSRIGAALIAISGAALVGAAVFPRDPSGAEQTSIGMTHYVFSMIAGGGTTLALFALAQAFKGDPRWSDYRGYTLATGIATAILGLALVSAAIEGWMGALQRIALAVPLVWMEVISIRLLRT